MRRALRRSAMTLAMANCVFGLTGCGGTGEPASAAGASIPPPLPTPTPAPAPTPAPPPSSTYSATVSWSVPLLNTDGSTLTDINGYRVYYGTSATNLAQSEVVAGANVTSYVVNGLVSGTYYFAVAVVNSSGVESVASNTAFKAVP